MWRHLQTATPPTTPEPQTPYHLNPLIIVQKLIMFMLLSEQATSNPHGPYGRPSSRGHHVGDPWFRFSTLLARVVQPSVLLSCVSFVLQATGNGANKFKNQGPLADL